MTAPLTPTVLTPGQARARLQEFIVIDVRTPGEYASGHVPGALNLPLDHVRRALPELRAAAGLLVVCASGARSENACAILAAEGIPAATLDGGTNAWAAEGNDLRRPDVGTARSVWGMERQVRFTAGTLVLLGLLLGFLVHPAWQLVSAGIAGGLVFSALTNTCGMAAVLARLPHNRPRGGDVEATLAALRAAQGTGGA
ncbi:rhodanese domain-containing protein [Streptomyces davaonensis JCM 4913]|uniref:Rhodanese domain-containing protein n=1 Tax=Streptomyces davaonensis (strain DSM 101723 / JCM 4913 / KCC S-0913 / 768) TaxID=1214101 RepID=K4RFR1_STRDJ|nr:rhodanese-like domain-containing protein [Streptomyces davaonensis]CCK31939.1 rhodanese domain-containing protein [Streptomyces davaonensis JCM 4913]